MPELFGLPRELRDMIYMSVIAWSLPQPRRDDTQNHKWRRIRESDSTQSGEYGCSYSTETIPGTCANLLACSRQINLELTEAIERAKRSGLLVAKLNCIADSENTHAFSWLSLPIVTNRPCEQEEKHSLLPSWADRIFTTPQRMLKLGNRSPIPYLPPLTTTLDNLWIDIRIHGNRTAKWENNQCPPDRTSWAICAALKRFFDGDALMRPINATPTPGPSSKNIMIDELILNVVSPWEPMTMWLPEDYPLDVATYGIVHPRTVAKKLLDMWNIIWTGEGFKGAHYRVLLERLKRVKISVDGETWRVRELGMELKRGQEERKRIAMRGGW
ncbi:uncharacterized protein EKO05_0010974 [Ascochyta rabiei]|uniref:Uncharacterized protein n=1 Tax=Didymella rabiei TaxID=5454 RepID=A0A163GK29_DIDRA|nr:uncharacterized protein EKO05_0010974 [Ascochyta rabiei]KZM24894.1 hypothetical protein ST47_g3968 [Ascochyta rabiei]UPX20753.1 hypothetical protein EKO05_0010974 [Ascochyta rabiei]